MIVAIGSKNPVKISAVEEYFKNFCNLTSIEVLSFSVPSGVQAQPATLEETIQGAINRARAVFSSDVNMGIGIEGGIAPIPLTLTGYMNICACCIFDGQYDFVGLSSGFEHPKQVLSTVLAGQAEVSQAYHLCGLHDSKSIGQGLGAIGFMTSGLLSRKEYCMQALMTAFGSYSKKDLLI